MIHLRLLLFVLPFLSPLLFAAEPSAASHPVPAEERKAIRETYSRAEKLNAERIQAEPKKVDAYSRRGDARLFLGNFAGAAEDYEKMIQLDPSLDVSHWRLGIAYYYLNRFDKAAHQFEIYHNYDDVDRENGIWRFMSQTRNQNMEAARKNLLKYKKTDRPPYPQLYALYAGEIGPEEVFAKIKAAEFTKAYEIRVRFHADLYVGIHHELNGRNKEALRHLRAAAANEYGRATGTYMWQVARLHYDLFQKKHPQKP